MFRWNEWWYNESVGVNVVDSFQGIWSRASALLWLLFNAIIEQDAKISCPTLISSSFPDILFFLIIYVLSNIPNNECIYVFLCIFFRHFWIAYLCKELISDTSNILYFLIKLRWFYSKIRARIGNSYTISRR